ncbi:MAG: hypothetical protein ABSH39_22160 [Candidatus Acidiferrum sp.]|jgi:hypothetical protein
MRILTRIFLILVVGTLLDYVHGGGFAVPQAQAPEITSSPLNGNWNIAGDRSKEQYPLVSMFLQVEGTHAIAAGHVEVRCPDDPRNGEGAQGASTRGEIAPDGSFAIKHDHAVATLKWEIRGHVPPEGATTWSGEYTLKVDAGRKCSAFEQTKSFTATRLPKLEGKYSGSLHDSGGSESKFTITVTQGDVVARSLKTGAVHYDLPLVGKVQVKDCSCFSRGAADPVTYSTHGSIPSPRSELRGDYVTLKFTMDDESELDLNANFADPGESAIHVFGGNVIGGKCAHRAFQGTLKKQR